MAVVSISQAAKMVRKGRQTLYNHNEKGKLSFTKTEDGKPGVDTSELQRVYGKLHVRVDSETGQDSVKQDTSRQVETPEIDSMDKGLKAELQRISEQLDSEKTERRREREQLEDQIADLRQQRDKWEEQASSATRLLTYQEEKSTPKPRRFFGLLKG